MVSSTTIEVSDPDDARKVLRIIDALEDNDDVQDVYGNFDISDELMEASDERLAWGTWPRSSTCRGRAGDTSR